MKRSCEHIERLLYDKGIKGLSPFERMRLKIHAARCAECRGHVVFEKGLSELFAGARVYDCPPEVREFISRRTAGERRSVQTLGRLFALRRYSYAAVAAAALVIIFLLHPLAAVRQEAGPEYTPEQIARARKQAEWSLALTGSLLNKTNREAVEDVLLNKVPESIKTSLEKSLQLF
ncbi:hypothetical protein JXO52_08075 [bacterium]|nr:hypothetical protein [bacterium]